MRNIPPVNQTHQIIQSEYRASHRRLFLFDYDGTLTPIKNHPAHAHVSPELRATLEALSGNLENTVAIVSGRKAEDLDERFGSLPIALVAEHGAAMKLPGALWQQIVPDVSDWIDVAASIMKRASALLPDSFVEEKQYSVVLHTRHSDPQKAKLAIKVTSTKLRAALSGTSAELLLGKQVLEVRHKEAHKGNAAVLLARNGSYDFVLGAGDDTTDEDLFAAIPQGFTIRIGRAKTNAAFRISTVSEFLTLLSTLVEPA